MGYMQFIPVGKAASVPSYHCMRPRTQSANVMADTLVIVMLSSKQMSQNKPLKRT